MLLVCSLSAFYVYYGKSLYVYFTPECSKTTVLHFYDVMIFNLFCVCVLESTRLQDPR